MASQHRRGGKHAVKDEDLTHTKYDDYNRTQLLAAVKAAGCYVKDDKKSVMARKLAEYDRNKLNEERRTAHERKEKEDARQQEIKNIMQAQRDRRNARARRNVERAIQYERGEDVSSNSDDTDDDQDRCATHKLTVTGGDALSDETWEDTCSDTTVRSENPPVLAGCRLQLLEWPYPNAPLQSPPSDHTVEQLPAPLTYVPLKLLTTITHEKIALPGKQYPTGVDPDYVPILDPLTRSAARHGHLIGDLVHAVIEPASVWATRTTVQAWNGRMYFGLPAQSHLNTKHVRLDDVYRKWHTANTKLLQPTLGVDDVKLDRKSRSRQRANNKRKQLVEVYETSLWKPSAVGYLPSFLDWEAGAQTNDNGMDVNERTMENLWYVRYPGCDVPHYYFWCWNDASRPDPSWSAEAFKQHSRVAKAARPRINLQTNKFRVRKLSCQPTHNVAMANCCEAPPTCYENDILAYGLRSTLKRYGTLAVAAGKGQEWAAFTRHLPRLYPSGELPRAHPVQLEMGVCVADKIAALLSGQLVEPYSGDEGWTRNDDDFWAVIDQASHGAGLVSDVASSTGLVPSLSDAEHSHLDDQVDALHRRDSMDVLPPLPLTHILTWLSNISTTYSPPSTPLSSSPIPIDIRPSVSLPTTRNTSLTCPFCSLSWRLTPDWERAAHMLLHSQISSQPPASLATPNVQGKPAKRRHSLLSDRTLASYHKHFCGRRVRGDVRSVAESVAESLRGSVEPLVVACRKKGRERSPFSKERKRGTVRSRQGRG